METKLTFDMHPGEEMLEEYCFNRLPDRTRDAVEEHLLVCPTCQETLQDLDRYILLMKQATAGYNVIPSSGSGTSLGRAWERVRSTVAWPGLSSNWMWAGGLGLACGMALITWVVVSAQIVQKPLVATVTLAAFRGGEEVAMARAPAGRLLDLEVDLTDLPASGVYRLEVVSASGQRVWDRMAAVANGKLSALTPRVLTPGVYWVRLYSGQGELQREYGLRLE